MKNRYTIQDWIIRFELLIVLSAGTLGFPLMTQAQDSLCAEVKIEINQELTLERQAFEAHMRIKNGISYLGLEDLHVTVTITDEEGRQIAASPDSNATGAAFFLRLDGTSGLEDLQEDANQLDFTARVAPSSTADMYWLLIPAPGSGEPTPDPSWEGQPTPSPSHNTCDLRGTSLYKGKRGRGGICTSSCAL